MSRSRVLLTVSAAAMIATTATAAAIAQPSVPLIPREALFGNPEKAGSRISPDGNWLSWIAPRDGVLNVWSSFDVYIAGENSLGRVTTGFLYEVTEGQAQQAIAFFDAKIGGKKPTATSKHKKSYLIEDYFALGAEDQGRANVKDYYSFLGEEMSNGSAAGVVLRVRPGWLRSCRGRRREKTDRP